LSIKERKTTMTPTPPGKISRRDALKILTAAAGAAALANLPPKWSKPGVEVGVLPAHAQTSIGHVLQDPPPPELLDSPDACYDGQNVGLTAVISPPTAGILLQYTLTYNVTGPGGSITSPVSLTGTLSTNVSGQVNLVVTVTPDSPFFGTEGTLTVVWSFVNPGDGTNTVSQDVDIEIAC
jgi:hypothetical protein